MSRKPAELSPNLVAVKGAAAPMPGMPGRSTEASPVEAAKPKTAGKEASREREELLPLNFRISASFRRDFKTYAATHDMKLNELLRLCFDAYRKQRRD